jgi:Ca2+-binding EF-hand superfamily protein
MKLLIAQSFQEKLEVFFETFDLDKNSSFSWDEIYKICQSILSQMLCTTSSASKEGKEEDFLSSLSTYFTKFIFQCVGYDLDAELPFDELRRVIRNAEGGDSDLLKMFCGVDQFTDPV